MDDKKIGEILRGIYRRLLTRYGPQHWWPAREPFEVIIGAILTQSTAWTNVEKAIANLKTTGKLNPEGLRGLSDKELSDLIRPCGYYNVKACRLKALLKWLREYCNDDLERLFQSDIEDLRGRFLDIHGIGEETADAIILYAGNKPVFVVDAYTRRIIDRLGFKPEDLSYAGYQRLFTGNLPADTRLFNEYHALLVRHAKEVCRKKPLCRYCCLNLKKSADRNKVGGSYPCYINFK
jgi:endonuclease-3 related protein